MKYSISDKRKKILREKFFEYTFQKKGLDTETLDSISEPIELDFIAKNHNYDDGNEILLHIVKNPHCDLSTARMIFFRSDLDGYISRQTKTDDENLINTITKNSENDFYKEENFFYNPEEDPEVLVFDRDKAKSIFPKILFENGKGRKIEPNFAEKFYQRKITNPKINILKNSQKLEITNDKTIFEYTFPEDFKIISENETIKFLRNYKFPEYLEKSFSVNENQLKKALIEPELVIKNNNTVIVFFPFNSASLLLENALTNVATMMRNEFVNIQAFLTIKGVEEDFEKIKRIKHNENWFALSKIMQVKITTIPYDIYLKILLLEKNNLLYYFMVFSTIAENLENEKIENQIINRITLK